MKTRLKVIAAICVCGLSAYAQILGEPDYYLSFPKGEEPETRIRDEGSGSETAVGGAAVPHNFYPHDLAYGGTAFLSTRPKQTLATKLFTPMHELVHVFGYPDHVHDDWNVLGGASDTNSVFASKRLTMWLIDIMRKEGEGWSKYLQ